MAHDQDDPPLDPSPADGAPPTSDALPTADVFTPSKLEDRPIPDRIGRYRILKRVGQGGMGTVYVAVREEGELRVALKVVRYADDHKEVIDRFQLERRVLSAMNHPNIARFIDGGLTDDGRPYFVMEFIEGEPIDQYCDRNRLNVAERLALFSKVCHAIHYCHQNLIVHRDIKPSNILVTPEGEPKVLDFGIAKVINPMIMASLVVTGPTLRLMTPEYASPEQVMGKPVTTASDIYSLGVLLYELLTGRRPYNFKSRLHAEVQRIICEVEPERPSTCVTHAVETQLADGTSRRVEPSESARVREGRPERLSRRLRGDVDNIILMAMRKSPNRRYESAEQLADDIRRHLSDIPIRGRPESLLYVASKFVHRNRWRAAAGVGLVVALVAGLVGTTWQRNAAVDQRRRAEEREAQVRAILTTIIDDVQDEATRLKDAAPIRRLISQLAADHLAQLDHDGPDPLLARSLDRLSEVEDGLSGATLGETDAAMKHALEALRIRQDALAADPADPQARRDMVTSLVRVARLEYKARELASASTRLDEAIALARALVAASPDDPAQARPLAIALQQRADLAIASGSPDEAPPLLKESLALRQAALDAQPNDLDRKRDLTVIQLRLAQEADRRGDAEEGLALTRKALELRQAIEHVNPTSARARRDAMGAHQALARRLVNVGRLTEAAAHAEQAQARADELVRVDDVRAWNDLSDVRVLWADLHLKAGELDAAAAAYQELLDDLRPLAESPEPSSKLRRLVIEAHEGLSQVRRSAGEYEEARASCAAAIIAAEGMAVRYSEDPWPRNTLARIQTFLASDLSQLGRTAEADASYKQAAASYAKLADDGVLDGRFTAFQAFAHRKAAEAWLRSGDAAQALQNADRALACAPDGTPGGYALLWQARALHALGRPQEAEPVLHAALDLAQADEDLKEEVLAELARFSPDNTPPDATPPVNANPNGP